MLTVEKDSRCLDVGLRMVSRGPFLHFTTFPSRHEDDMALGSDGRLTTAGHDGYALFVAGLENLAH